MVCNFRPLRPSVKCPQLFHASRKPDEWARQLNVKRLERERRKFPQVTSSTCLLCCEKETQRRLFFVSWVTRQKKGGNHCLHYLWGVENKRLPRVCRHVGTLACKADCGAVNTKGMRSAPMMAVGFIANVPRNANTCKCDANKGSALINCSQQ